MKIYLAIKYHADLSNKALIERICGIAEETHQVICGHRDLEKWGEVSFSENELMEKVFGLIDESDAVLVEFSEAGIGVGVEAGYARAKNIPVYIMRKKGSARLSAVMKGVCGGWFEYETDEDIRKIIDKCATERFDILDINGEPTGLTAEKGAELRDGQYYLGVHVYIHNPRGEFLLQQRSFDKAFLPGGWDVLLEHVIAGETSEEGAARGIHEEIGLRFQNGGLNFAGRFKWESYHHLIDVYFLKADFQLEELTVNGGEVIGVKLVSAEDMLKIVDNMDYRPVEYRQMIKNEIGKLNLT